MSRVAVLLVLAGVAAILAAGGATAQREPPLPVRAVIPMIAADSAVSAGSAALALAERRWAASGIDGYGMTVTIARFGPLETHRVVVQGEALVSAESVCTLGEVLRACGSVDYDRLTVPGLFAFIRARLTGAEAAPAPPPGIPGQPFVDVTYDPLTGRAAEVAWGLRGVADIGERMTVTGFTVFSRR
ncbi:MAG: hypothetical protein ACKVT1_01835 [Dehalococcoidia bacterium]